MTLKEYLEKEELTPTAFGKLLGLKSRASVLRWLSGERVPSKDNMLKISLVTNRQVTPDSFYH